MAVALPGRFDADPEVLKNSPWPTIFNPAGFTFAIWGVIYLGELAGTAAVLRSSAGGALERAVDASNDAWLAANVAQAAWCAAFRPWALSRLWLPTLLLATTALCLFVAQLRAFGAESTIEPLGLGPRLLVLVPRSIHLGWVSAATLVNLNAWLGYKRLGPALALAGAILSIAGALLLGVLYTCVGAPTAAAALAWALLGLSKGHPLGSDAIALGSEAMRGLATAEAGAAALIVLSIAGAHVAMGGSWMGL